MCGVRYASAVAVYPRGTSFTIGSVEEEVVTWAKPTSRASAATASSCWRYVYACISTTATASTPDARSAASLPRSASKSGSLSMSTCSPVSPRTRRKPRHAADSSPGGSLFASSTRSSTSTTASYSTPGQRTRRSKMSGLACDPMCSTSAKPLLTRSAVRAPSRSSSALVATVVPIRIHSIRDEFSRSPRGCGTPVAASSTLRIPSRGASG
mmetsp:Transcript_18458/g.58995  ORF Transcript_18458/g.58995 Transcript_18458/m.58995 type:complete len:211 (-) Transcript_18458:464-1096(-)